CREVATTRIGRARLFASDVGRDATVLRGRYPDRSRYIVAGAVLRLQYRKPWDEKRRAPGGALLSGSVAELLVSAIHVPLARRPVLDAVVKEMSAGTRQAGWWEGS